VDYLEIVGCKKLRGSVEISGAKNSALPLLTSTILSDSEITISNLPNVVDIKTMLKLLSNLGAIYELNGTNLKIDSSYINNVVATYDIVRTMRASILVLGPLLARFGECKVSLPGGCAIGQRPVDLHLKAFRQMGAEIDIKQGYIHAKVKKLKGNVIIFDKITVTGTENVIMAASLAYGKTTIINAAKEPEVIQLCEVLKEAGVDISGIGTDEINIIGTEGELLNFKCYSIIPDRIEAGTYLVAGAITNSEITVNNVIPTHLEATILKLNEMGFKTKIDCDKITIFPTNNIKPINIITSEYPGFPTDMQAQFMALSCLANGVSIIDERLFENRFMHVSELNRMGANIKLNKTIASITGIDKLYGTDVMATDLRASSALVLAGLVADGVTNVHRIYHLDRGYDNLEQKLKMLGAEVCRKQE